MSTIQDTTQAQEPNTSEKTTEEISKLLLEEANQIQKNRIAWELQDGPSFTSNVPDNQALPSLKPPEFTLEDARKVLNSNSFILPLDQAIQMPADIPNAIPYEDLLYGEKNPTHEPIQITISQPTNNPSDANQVASSMVLERKESDIDPMNDPILAKIRLEANRPGGGSLGVMLNQTPQIPQKPNPEKRQLTRKKSTDDTKQKKASNQRPLGQFNETQDSADQEITLEVSTLSRNNSFKLKIKRSDSDSKRNVNGSFGRNSNAKLGSQNLNEVRTSKSQLNQPSSRYSSIDNLGRSSVGGSRFELLKANHLERPFSSHLELDAKNGNHDLIIQVASYSNLQSSNQNLKQNTPRQSKRIGSGASSSSIDNIARNSNQNLKLNKHKNGSRNHLFLNGLELARETSHRKDDKRLSLTVPVPSFRRNSIATAMPSRSRNNSVNDISYQGSMDISQPEISSKSTANAEPAQSKFKSRKPSLTLSVPTWKLHSSYNEIAGSNDQSIASPISRNVSNEVLNTPISVNSSGDNIARNSISKGTGRRRRFYSDAKQNPFSSQSDISSESQKDDIARKSQRERKSEGSKQVKSEKKRSKLTEVRNSIRADNYSFDLAVDHIDGILSFFNEITSAQRQFLLLSLLRQCDPYDMRFLYKVIPDLHRNFLVLLPNDIVFRILGYVDPPDIITVSRVCKEWAELANMEELWFVLYSNLGLQSMANVFYKLSSGTEENAKRYESLGNWAHGRLHGRYLKAHDMGILCVSFDGKYIATGSSDKTAKIFSIRTGSCLKTFSGHTQGVTCIQFDNGRVITGSADSTIRVWARDTSNAKHILLGHSRPVTCLKYHNGLLVSGSQDTDLRIWCDLSTDKVSCVRVLSGHSGAIKCLDLVPDRVIVSGDLNGEIRLWHISSGNCLNSFGFDSLRKLIPLGIDEHTTEPILPVSTIISDPISSLELSCSRFQVSTLSGHIYLFNVQTMPETFDERTSFTDFQQWANTEDLFTIDKQFSRDGNQNRASWTLTAKHDQWRLMSGSSDGICSVWNHRAGKLLYSLNIRDKSQEQSNIAKNQTRVAITGIAFDDFYIIAGITDGMVKIWEPAQNKIN